LVVIVLLLLIVQGPSPNSQRFLPTGPLAKSCVTLLKVSGQRGDDFEMERRIASRIRIRIRIRTRTSALSNF
jgi:hypothetical protein